jgi:hypothetical protein
MAAKKMFPPGGVEKVFGRHVESPFGDDYDEVKLRIAFRILAGQIVMQFSDLSAAASTILPGWISACRWRSEYQSRF